MKNEDYESRKRRGEYNDGCAVITGRIWRGLHKDKNLVCIDFDNAIAIQVFLERTFPVLSCKTLQELSQITIVEEHEDAKGKRAHVYFVTAGPITKRNKPQRNKSMEGTVVPELEIKSDSSTYAVCSPTVHMNGYPYQIIGTRDPLVLDVEQSKNLDEEISEIYNTYRSNPKYSNPNLSDELRLVASTRRIGKDTPKIPQGSRSNTLISLVRVILNQQYESTDIQDIKSFVEEVNLKLCEPPLSPEELDGIWETDLKYLLKDLDSGKLKAKRNDGNGKGSPKARSKTEFLTFRYTQKGQIYESVIVAEKPYFLSIKDEEVILESSIEEETRILRPPAPEEYPGYIPYTLKDTDEIKSYIELVNSSTLTLDLIVTKIREQISKYVVHHDHVLNYITALTLFSYFQDKFPTVPYTMFVSDNGSGKSTIGNVFECFAYRCVNMTNPTTANIFRIFGTIESGQCILVLDEAEKIDQVQEMMSILKSGYEKGKKVQRINPFGKQEHFQTYGIKIMLAERSPNSSVAKGVLDRTFIISNYKGRPLLDIKERKNSKDGKSEFSFLKNLLLIYRLTNCNKSIVDIEIGLDGRDKELCKPLLQFFFGTKFQTRLENALEKLLDEKNLRKSNSLERDLLEIVDNLLAANGLNETGIIEFSEIWNKLVEKTNGQIDEFKSNQLDTEMYGRLYKRTISNILRDKFGAEDPKHRNATRRFLCFDRRRIRDFLIEYTKDSRPSKITCKLLVSYSSDASDSNFESLSTKFFSSRVEGIMNESDELNRYIKNDRLKGKPTDKTREPSDSDPSKGFENSVTTVTTVTDAQPNEPNLQRSHPHSDIWTCPNCKDKGDRPYMLKHPCKNNKKNI
jgi:hypothetical protein